MSSEQRYREHYTESKHLYVDMDGKYKLRGAGRVSCELSRDDAINLLKNLTDLESILDLHKGKDVDLFGRTPEGERIWIDSHAVQKLLIEVLKELKDKSPQA